MGSKPSVDRLITEGLIFWDDNFIVHSVSREYPIGNLAVDVKRMVGSLIDHRALNFLRVDSANKIPNVQTVHMVETSEILNIVKNFSMYVRLKDRTLYTNNKLYAALRDWSRYLHYANFKNILESCIYRASMSFLETDLYYLQVDLEDIYEVIVNNLKIGLHRRLKYATTFFNFLLEFSMYEVENDGRLVLKMTDRTISMIDCNRKPI